MASLTANRELQRTAVVDKRTLAVAAATHPYKHAFLGLAAGYARPLIAGDAFAGVAVAEVDNSTGAAGAKTVQAWVVGDFEHALAGVAAANVGQDVYASDDHTLTLSPTGNSLVGRVQGVAGTDLAIVRITPGAAAQTGGGIANKTQADSPVALTAADGGTRFTTVGASGTVHFDLPAIDRDGVEFTFIAGAAQAIQLDPDDADQLVVAGGVQTAGLYVAFDDEGEALTVTSILVADQGYWLCRGSGTFTVETP